MHLPCQVGSVVAWRCLLPVTKVTTHLSIEFSLKHCCYLKLRRPHSSSFSPDRSYSPSKLTISARLCPLQSEYHAPVEWLEVPPTPTPNVYRLLVDVTTPSQILILMDPEMTWDFWAAATSSDLWTASSRQPACLSACLPSERRSLMYPIVRFTG